MSVDAGGQRYQRIFAAMDDQAGQLQCAQLRALVSLSQCGGQLAGNACWIETAVVAFPYPLVIGRKAGAADNVCDFQCPFLRSRRALLTPRDVGLPTGGNRRMPGLRREELAIIAGISPDHYQRIEQGRSAPSVGSPLTTRRSHHSPVASPSICAV